jgi:alpha-beta hydrolase superfamily lysophospholipase
MQTPAPRIDFYPAADGYRCAARVWEAERPVGRVVWVHGIISHGGWYFGSCRHLARAGLEVHFLDRRGSGLNAARRGHVDRWETWLRDVEIYLERLPSGLPTVLVGISWGGKLATAVARSTRHPLAGLGLLCPGLFAKKGPGPAGRFALRLARRLGLQNRYVTIPLQDPALFTDCAPWQQYIARDPFTLRKVTIAFALADQELSRYATETPEEVRVPVLLMLAGRDRIIDNARVRDFVERTHSPEKRIIEYPEAAHTFDFEPDPSRFYADLAGWVCERRATI